MGEDRAVAQQGATWGDDLLDVVEAGTEPGRFRRGEHLWVEGAVDVVEVRPGSFRATVHGSGGTAHAAVLEVQRLSRDELPAAVGALVRDPGWKRARADGGVLGPDGFVALDTRCTCPDGESSVCPHAIALAHEVAGLIDGHPRHWLTARGLPLGFGGAAAPAAVVRPPPGEEPLTDLGEDWFSPRTPVPELPDGLRPRPAPDERDPDRLRDLFRPELLGTGPPSEVDARLDAAASGLDAIYRALTRPLPRALPEAGDADT